VHRGEIVRLAASMIKQGAATASLMGAGQRDSYPRRKGAEIALGQS
jgi:hypothetical protein